MPTHGLDLNSAYPHLSQLPKSTYGFQTHNLYKDFPPFMNDGRVLVASWQQESVTNNNLLQSTGMKSNWEYRRHLTENAKAMIEQNQAESLNDIGYIARYSTAPEQSTTVPYYYKSYLDNTQPFGYQSSDLKQLYLTAEQLNARKMAPVIRDTHFINESP
jgi:hypothetical protein